MAKEIDKVESVEQITVLIVDDNLANHTLIMAILRELKYTFLNAKNGRQALDMLDIQDIDVILLDIMMPDMNGLEVLEIIRETRSEIELPVIMVSALDESKDVANAIGLGANDYVTKPIDRRILLARIRAALSIRQMAKTQKEIEDVLQKAHEELEKKVEERTRDLRAANAHLKQEMAEREQLEQQFLQSQKMEAFGKLAGGVAHDFNNLLTVINGYTQLLQNRLAEGDPMTHMLGEIHNAGDRATRLTRQLLAFSRRQVLEPQVLNLNDVVEEMHKMLARLIGEDIVLTEDLEDALGFVEVDPGQMEQVVMNLAVNARDAMPEGGKLTIITQNADVEETQAKHLEVASGAYVMLAVSDTGCGMSEDVLAQIFEPFFTTKEEGQGTGLGLSTVFGIVKQSGAGMEVESAVSKGTTFKIYFPKIEDRVVAVDQDQRAQIQEGGSETILLVEDEETVLNLASDVLTELGYTVLEAQCGEDALQLCKQHDGSVNLLLSDVVMPEMSGRALAERVTALYPGVRVLYMSGYTDGIIAKHGVLEAEIELIQKPFEPAELTRKVREILDGSGQMGV